jgi:hypothetical protein
MSKPKESRPTSPAAKPTPAEPSIPIPFEGTDIEVQLDDPTPPAVAVQVPIGDCLGKMVGCPQCGKPAYVDHARGARTATQVISSRFWVLVTCKGYCGKRLEKIGTPVTPEAEPEPEVITRTLGEAVGKWILCPRESCRARAQAAWTIDDGHVVTCGQCQTRPYPGTTIVEIVG